MNVYVSVSERGMRMMAIWLDYAPNASKLQCKPDLWCSWVSSEAWRKDALELLRVCGTSLEDASLIKASPACADRWVKQQACEAAWNTRRLMKQHKQQEMFDDGRKQGDARTGRRTPKRGKRQA